MTLEELGARLEGTGMPVTYLAWPEGEAPELPFVCYRSTGTDTLPADGGVYYQWDNARVELYTRLKDPAAEQKVETALSGIHWTKDETYIDSEGCFLIVYEIDV